MINWVERGGETRCRGVCDSYLQRSALRSAHMTFAVGLACVALRRPNAPRTRAGSLDLDAELWGHISGSESVYLLAYAEQQQDPVTAPL